MVFVFGSHGGGMYLGVFACAVVWCAGVSCCQRDRPRQEESCGGAWRVGVVASVRAWSTGTEMVC